MQISENDDSAALNKLLGIRVRDLSQLDSWVILVPIKKDLKRSKPLGPVITSKLSISTIMSYFGRQVHVCGLL